MYKKILNCLKKIKTPSITILGLTFKPNTDDMRDSPSLDIIPALMKKGCKVNVFDPEGMSEAKKSFGSLSKKINWFKDSYSACSGSDAVVILTEWNEFRALDLKKIKRKLMTPILIDLRNIYKPEEMKRIGLQYYSIGRPLK